MQGCLPLSQPWPFARSQGHPTVVTYGLQGDCPTATWCGDIPVTWSLVCHHPLVSSVGQGAGDRWQQSGGPEGWSRRCWGITNTQMFLALNFLWETSWRGEDGVWGSRAVLGLWWVLTPHTGCEQGLISGQGLLRVALSCRSPMFRDFQGL